MEKNYPLSPNNKKEYLTEIGKLLVQENGKKKYYKPKEVKKAHRDSSWFNVLDFSCWGMSVYSSHSDFDKYHQENGEVCNYVEMKSEMISNFSETTTESWLDIPNFDIDDSWLDLGGFFEGVAEFIGSILDT